MRHKIYPIARKKGLLITKVDDEAVVCDTISRKASCLNQLTTAVWEACDGKTDITSLLISVRQAGYEDATEQIIRMAIEQLNQADLLENLNDIDGMNFNPSRREMLRSLGKKTALTLPAVSMIEVLPAIAQISGSLSNGTPCTSSHQCASGCCNENPKNQVCVNTGQGNSCLPWYV